jgi:hypothetical protein
MEGEHRIAVSVKSLRDQLKSAGKLASFAELLLESLRAQGSVSLTPINVYAEVNIPTTLLALLGKSEGCAVVMLPFQSFFAKPSEAAHVPSEAAGEGCVRVMLQLTCRGRPLVHSKHRGAEVLLPAGALLRVAGVKGELNGLPLVCLEDVDLRPLLPLAEAPAIPETVAFEFCIDGEVEWRRTTVARQCRLETVLAGISLLSGRDDLKEIWRGGDNPDANGLAGDLLPEGVLYEVRGPTLRIEGTVVVGPLYRGQSEAVIPSFCTAIAKCAFEGCEQLQSIVFQQPSAVVRIGKLAFSDCEGLKSVVFARDSKLRKIGGGPSGNAHCWSALIFRLALRRLLGVRFQSAEG